MSRRALVRVTAALGAALLVWLAAELPLWRMTLQAPQYPKGLRVEAFGSGMTGDLRELNILNHYVGMRPLDPAPPLETAVFPVAIVGLIVLCLAAPLHRWIRRTTVLLLVAMPVGILADLQWWLYTYGHSLDPTAPIRLPAFTPAVLGTSAMGNFISTATISSGIVALLGAAALLAAGEWAARRVTRRASAVTPHAAAVAASMLALAGGAVSMSALPGSTRALQALIDAAPPGSTLTVPPGTYAGPIVIRGPLTVVGAGMPIVDGGGSGSVVTIEGNDVTLRGFAIRNSGRNVTEEAAGIRAAGSRHRIAGNDLRDVYFGVLVEGGSGHVIENNVIIPGGRRGARPGHGVSLWNTDGARVTGNRISAARDGVYLSFTRGTVVSANDVSRCRYGLHSMYSENARFLDNRLAYNLLGSALMNSDRLELRGNRIEQHRQGSAAYGILLKDIGDLIAEDNVIVANRIGLYAEGVPDRPSRKAIVRRNVIAGNEVGLALQGSAALIVTANRIADNLTDVRPLGRQLSAGTRWSEDGVGNSWSQYRGYDADRDGVGDLPHRVETAMDAFVQSTPLAQAFLYTPAHLALEAAARMFPLFRQPPVLVDEHPLMRAPAGGLK